MTPPDMVIETLSALPRPFHPICERLTFAQLLAYSEPKRIARSRTVRGPSLGIEAFKNGFLWTFNFKSTPSTTGLRHHGYIRFFKPKNQNTQLQNVPCEVDCSCQDFRYVWAWADKQRGASRVGPMSVNKAWNQAPRIKNPEGSPGLCKHTIALKDWLYGAYSTWDWESTDTTSRKLDKLVRWSNGRQIRGDTLAKQQAYAQVQADQRAAAERGEPAPPAGPPIRNIPGMPPSVGSVVQPGAKPGAGRPTPDPDGGRPMRRYESLPRQLVESAVPEEAYGQP